MDTEREGRASRVGRRARSRSRSSPSRERLIRQARARREEQGFRDALQRAFYATKLPPGPLGHGLAPIQCYFAKVQKEWSRPTVTVEEVESLDWDVWEGKPPPEDIQQILQDRDEREAAVARSGGDVEAMRKERKERRARVELEMQLDEETVRWKKIEEERLEESMRIEEAQAAREAKRNKRHAERLARGKPCRFSLALLPSSASPEKLRVSDGEEEEEEEEERTEEEKDEDEGKADDKVVEEEEARATLAYPSENEDWVEDEEWATLAYLPSGSDQVGSSGSDQLDDRAAKWLEHAEEYLAQDSQGNCTSCLAAGGLCDNCADKLIT